MRRTAVILLALIPLALAPKLTCAQTAPATQPAPTAKAHYEAFFRKNLIDAYETAGMRDTKWDALARNSMEVAAHRWTLDEPDRDTDWQMLYYSEEALKLECRDPVIIYNFMRGGTSFDGNFPPQLVTPLIRNMMGSNYAPFLKVATLVHVAQYINSANPKADAPVRQLFSGVFQNLPATMAEADFPQETTAALCADLTTVGKNLDGDRKPIIDAIFEVMSKAQPNSPVPDLFKAIAYQYYAWDARGTGFANTVTNQGAKLMDERLAVAKDSLGKALTKDPHFAPASREMIAVLLGMDEDRPQMEKYFKRAVADDPDCYMAYRDKLYYLTPKWHGTVQDQLDFGRECLATKRWQSRIPFLLVSSQRHMSEDHARTLCTDLNDPAAWQKASDQALDELHRTSPDSWKDVKTLYDGYLAWNPNAVFDRIDYARLALGANHPEIAQQQLDNLRATNPAFKDAILQPELRAAVKAALAK